MKYKITNKNGESVTVESSCIFIVYDKISAGIKNRGWKKSSCLIKRVK